MAIISASRRTDIPAYYGQWLVGRFEAGWVEVVNPFRPDQVRRISLAREDVDGLVLWTRRPRPFLPRLDRLDRLGLPNYLMMTLTAMPLPLEPGLPPEAELVEQFLELSGRVGPGRLIWRFDPLLITVLTPPDEIAARFSRLADRLAGHCDRVVISPARFYAKTKRRLGRIDGLNPLDPAESPAEMLDLAAGLVRAARLRGLTITACASPELTAVEGLAPNRCIDPEVFNRAYGLSIPYRPDKGQRSACGCSQSIDIGAYNTCLHGCRYCYATISSASAEANHRRHRPEAARLVPARRP